MEGLGRVLRLLVLALVPPLGFTAARASEDAQPERLHLREGPVFEILATDRDAGAFVSNVTDVFKKWIQVNFGPTGPFREPVRVELGSGSVEPSGAPPHRVFIDQRGRVTVTFAWDGEVELESLCAGLSQSFFYRWAIRDSGIDGWRRVPSWLVAAAGESLRAAVVPGVPESLGWRLRNERLIPASDLLGDTLADESLETRCGQAYWMLRVIGRALPGRRARRAFLQDAARGGDAALELRKRLGGGEAIAEPALELFWAVGFQELTALAGRGMETPSRSRRDFQALLWVHCLTPGGDEVRASLSDLWSARGDSWLEETRERRLVALKRKLPRVNPLYYNVYHSYGLVLEAMAGDDEPVFRSRVGRLAEDWMTAVEREALAVHTLLRRESAPANRPNRSE